MNNSLKPCRKSSRVLRFRSAFALLALASLTGSGRLLADSSTFTTTAVNAGTGVDFNFDNAANWSNGIPGVAGSGTAAPATLASADVATFYASTTTLTAATAITLANTHNVQSIIAAQNTASLALTIGATTGPAFYLSDGGVERLTGGSTAIAAPTVLVGSATFDNTQTNRILTIGASPNLGSVTGSGVTGATLTLNSVGAANNVIYAKVGGTAAGANSLAVLKTGAGNWVLANTANTYTGGTTINGGALYNSVGTGGAILTTNMLGSGTVTINAGTLALTFNGGNTFNSPLVISANNTGTIIERTNGATNAIFAAQSVTGTGTLILSSNSGASTINAGLGRLANGTTASTTGAFGAFGGTIQISPTSATGLTTTVNVTDASAFASTTGTVNVVAGGILTSAVANINSGSAVTVAGGTLTPNGTNVGMLTLSANQIFSMTSGTLGLTLTGTGAGNFDQILGSGTGTFNLTGGALDLGGVTAVAGNSYQVFNGFASGAVSGITYTDFVAGDGSMPTLSSAGVLTFGAAVPEPGTYAQIGFLGLVGILVARSRKRNLQQA